MGIYRIADRVFELRCHYGYTERLCAGYAAVCESPDYILEASESEIMAEAVDDAAKFPPPYLESLALYRKIAESLINDDCFLFHAAVLEFDGKAYAFTAKSGTDYIKTVVNAFMRRPSCRRTDIFIFGKPVEFFCVGFFPGAKQKTRRF